MAPHRRSHSCGAPMDHRQTIGGNAIGDPCAEKRWQDHHKGVVVFFIGITTTITSEMFVMTLENNGKVEIPTAPQQEWHALNAEEVLTHLKVRGNGLTSEEAKKRLEHYGPNQLQEATRPTFLKMLWEQLNN